MQRNGTWRDCLENMGHLRRSGWPGVSLVLHSLFTDTKKMLKRLTEWLMVLTCVDGESG